MTGLIWTNTKSLKPAQNYLYYMEEVFKDLEEFFTLDNCLALLLMREEEKPGVLIMSADGRQKEKIREICNRFDWHQKTFGSQEIEKGLAGKIREFLNISKQNPFSSEGIFVARNEKRFEILDKSSGNFYGLDETGVGKFLGYEEDAVEFYANVEKGSTAVEPYREKLEEMLESGKLKNSALKYLELIFYVPVPDEDKILEAVEKGKVRHQVLSETVLGRKYLDKIKTDQL